MRIGFLDQRTNDGETHNRTEITVAIWVQSRYSQQSIDQKTGKSYLICAYCITKQHIMNDRNPHDEDKAIHI